jgi:SAM-dependent methyltransferase
VITTSNRTSLRCYNGSWVNRLLRYWILAAGPGRDLKAFSELGHIAVGLEGAEHFAVMARTYSGCEVWQQDFLKLDLPDDHFDGVYANASLFHIPSQELPRILLELHASLKTGWCAVQFEPVRP